MLQGLIFMLGFLAALSHPVPPLCASTALNGDAERTSKPTRPALPVGKPVISELISKHATRLGIDPLLIHAVVRQESGFNPRAVSPKGAMGLMQLMPGTASEMGVSDPFDPEQNIVGGIQYLRHCLVRFDGDLVKALAAYNAGPQSVERYGGCPPFEETRNYVACIMRTYTGEESLGMAKPGGARSGSNRLSPAALAILHELNPHRSPNAQIIAADAFEKPHRPIHSRLMPGAVAVLKELFPYRFQAPGNNTAQRRSKNR